MYRILHAILVTCIYNTNGADKELFDRNADDIFKSIIGDPYEINKKMIERGKTYKWYDHTLPPNISAILLSNISLNNKEVDEVITTTMQNQIAITTLKYEQIKENMTSSFDYYKFRLKKLEIKRILSQESSPLPNFAKDEDNPALVTRRFDMMRAESNQGNSYRREVYFDYQMSMVPTVYRIKMMMKDLIGHFVYVTRYKLAYVQLLRQKYKHLLKYQIGYCFSLLQHLSREQKNLYNSLKNYHNVLSNLMVQMKIYEKIVRLDIDIKDVCKLIKVLNYKRNLEDDENYYDDSVESNDMNASNGTGTPPQLRQPLSKKFRRAIRVGTRGITRTSLRKSIKPDTSQADMLMKRVMQISLAGFPKPQFKQDNEMQAQVIRSMPPRGQERRLYAPLPDVN